MRPGRSAWGSLHAAVRPAYQSLGYRGKSGTYQRYSAAGDAVLAAAYQRDTRTIEPSLRFCVELRVYLRPLMGGPHRALPPAIAIAWENPHWRERLAPMNGAIDYWWELDASDSVEWAAVVAWHVEAVGGRIDERLRQMGSVSALRVLWESAEFDGLADLERQRYLGILGERQ